MKKTWMALAAAAVMAAPEIAQAQFVFPGNTNVSCSLSDMTNIVVNKCSGFWNGNLLNTEAPNATDADETAGLEALGFGQTNVIEKIGSLGGATSVDFGTTLYGITIFAIHWGNGADRFKDADPAYNGNGGTAFYLFDAGVGGFSGAINFATSLNSGSSGATLYKTDSPGGGGECTNGGCVVPEPSTYALMAAGLAGLGFFARRRRNNA